MVKKRTIIYILQVAALLLFGMGFMWRCANASAPQGGPRDSLPPVILGASPDFYTVNFTPQKIYITFDEYVKLQDQQKEFFTSPIMEKKPVLTIKGRGVQIELKDTLAPNTTYALNFGSSLRDNNEGNPLNGLRYVFSTGPHIDSMFISGYTVDAYKKDSVKKTLIFFFEEHVDSIPEYDSTMFKSRPAAIARAENNGIFIAQNLKPINYRVYALEDNNGNFMYEPGIDKIGFLEGVYNPLELPDFEAWYDTTRNYMTADPQLYFRMFMDKQFKRQNLSASTRPLQHKIELMFNAPHPQIEELRLRGIDSAQIITEYLTPGRDTMNLWLNVPSADLPDTIRGHITYLKHDSINNLVPNTDSLRLVWRYIETREEIREREREERERERAEKEGEEYQEKVKPNPFKVNISARGEMKPEDNVVMEFDYPLTSMDSSRISLIRLAEQERMFKVRYSLRQDTVGLRRWIISAPWTAGQKYVLEIPAGVFHNVAGETNDSIKNEFTIQLPDKFGSMIVDVKGKTDSSMYILQLLDANGKMLQEKINVTTGQYTFSYITPGDVKIHVIEDSNGNGKWDSGDLIARIQPERVETFFGPSGSELIAIKAGWEQEFPIDMAELFRPIDIRYIREKLQREETQRLKRLAEEREKRRQQQQDSGQQGGGMGGFGSALGGIRSQF